MKRKDFMQLNSKYAKIIIDNFQRIDKTDNSEKHFFFEHMQFYLRKYLLELEQKDGFNKTYNDKKLKTEAIKFLKEEKEDLRRSAFNLILIHNDYIVSANVSCPIRQYFLQIKRGNLRPLIRDLKLNNLKISKNEEVLYELGDNGGFPVREEQKIN
ncbi:MAG: hypothetical protein ACOC1K_01870 [Nanoarchaeota archaeon]